MKESKDPHSAQLPLAHTHTFGQDSKQQGESRTLIVIAITATMMIVEIGSGIVFGSMALLADGIHMASHAVALSINAFAYVYARKKANDARFSFGTGKVNALGGFVGAVLLALFALMMVFESIERLFFPTEIAFNAAIGVAIVGLIVNGASVFILGHHGHSHNHDHRHHHHGHGCADHHHHDHGHHHDHNLRSAYLHVLADALTSLTAIFALLAAKYLGWIWMDPVMGIVGSALVAKWSIGLLKSTTKVLLDHQADADILDEVREKLSRNEDAIYDLHVWSIAPGKYGVIAGIAPESPRCPDDYRNRLDQERFPHITVEINRNN